MGFLNCKFISKEDFYLIGFHCLALVVQPPSHLLLIALVDDIIHLFVSVQNQRWFSAKGVLFGSNKRGL
jgi:hypothetical protein